MNDELATISGKYEELVGRLQEKFGIAREEAKEQIDEFKKSIDNLKRSNADLMRLQRSMKNGKTLKTRSIKTNKISKRKGTAKSPRHS
jgi:DNA polymerase I-like protein with 3'-5' exonuclease and polymerase domains